MSISVQSEGDNTERSTTLSVGVNAPTVDEEAPTESEDEDDPVLPDSSSLPWAGLEESLLLVLFVVFVVQRRR